MIMKFKTLAIIAASSAMSLPAFAADWDITSDDTAFASLISNTATFSYSVGTGDDKEDFSDDSNEAIFKVDRKVIFGLINDHSGEDNETVAIGEKATTVYTLTNDSNAPIDFLLPLPDANTTYTFIRPGDTDPTVLDNTSSKSERTISLSVGNLSNDDDAINITVASTVPATKGNGDTFDTSLSVVAIERTAAGTEVDPQLGTAGEAIAATISTEEWDADTVQTVVIADWLNADDEIERTSSQTFTVQTAIIYLKKEVKIISDPILGDIDAANNVYPKAIPGAIVQYTLTVVNKGPASASAITLTDTAVDQLIVAASSTFTPVYTAAGIIITPSNTTDAEENADLIISGQDLTFSKISVAADTNATDNTPNKDTDGNLIINESDGTTVITFTVKLK
jgi:uncharacterized repeat protein (TIGR01451 family)